jgi:hypothetical protein
MAEALKTFSFPVGGIADFYLEDHEKEALYKEKAQENFGSDGLGAIQDVAVRMASYGRYGDDKLVHAETGELVVPKALIDKNPKLKDSIFSHLKDMGIEDPERYVVGTEANSINPDTGLPEFFLKDIFDKVGDVIRKVAKPVLTIAGTAFFGPIYGAALGAGIGGLIQGESLEQAFGSALTAGATGGALSGLSGAFGVGTSATGLKGFMEGVGKAADFSNLQAIGGALTGGGMPETYFERMANQAATATGETATGAAGTSAVDKTIAASDPTKLGATSGTEFVQSGEQFIPKSQPSFFESIKQGNVKDAFFPGSGVTPQEVMAANKGLSYDAAAKIAADANRGFLSQNIGNIAAGTTLAAAGGFFDAPEMEDMDDIKTGQDLIDENRGKYIVQGTDVIPSQPPFMVPTRFKFNPSPPVQYAADGGEAKEFPRRNGGIGMDEGTPGKDSVRAMLMPGEFVMTTDAVNGAGNGDNEKGIRNMYAMMRNFEAKARA